MAFIAGVPAALAVFMILEWRDPREPLATWTELVTNSVWLAALEATPEATNKEPGDLDAQFAFEILRRTQARSPTLWSVSKRSMMASP